MQDQISGNDSGIRQVGNVGPRLFSRQGSVVQDSRIVIGKFPPSYHTHHAAVVDPSTGESAIIREGFLLSFLQLYDLPGRASLMDATLSTDTSGRVPDRHHIPPCALTAKMMWAHEVGGRIDGRWSR